MHGQVDTESTIYPQAKESIPDDDACVIRVSGFALPSAIEYRRELLPNFQYKHTSETCEDFADELELLKRMIAANTSFVPRVVVFQMRGNMTIVHQAMLNFGETLFSTVRSCLNYSSYLKSVAEVFKQTKEHHEEQRTI